MGWFDNPRAGTEHMIKEAHMVHRRDTMQGVRSTMLQLNMRWGMALAALLMAPMLGSGGLAYAQTDVWSATLTTGSYSGFAGCDNNLAPFPGIAACSDSSALTSDKFIHAGKTYSFTSIVSTASDEFAIDIQPPLTGTAKHYLTLVVDGAPLAFGDADLKDDGFSSSRRAWSNPGFRWSAGQSVSLRLEPKPPLPEGELGATNVFARRFSAGNVKITWNDITIDGAPLPPGQPDYAVTVSGGRRNTTWGLSHLETVFGDPLGRGNRYTVQHPTSTSDNNNQSDHDVAFTYTLKVIGDEWLPSGKTFLRIDCPAVGSANVVDCGLSTASSALRPFNASAYESYGPLQFRVEVDPAAAGTVTVDYATADRPSGTKRARAGQDYDATSGTLTFAPGETAKFVVVGIIDDAVRDGGETFYLNLSNATGATLSDGQVTGTINNTEPLTASFEGVPEAHDGQSAFSVRVAFSEEIGISYQTLRDESFTTTGGAVTGARRVDGRNDLWEITVEPSGADNVTITLPRGRDCGTTGAVCTREDTPRALTNSPSATVKGPSASEGDPPPDPPDPSEPLTASFSGVPGEHTGESFTFGLDVQRGRGGAELQDVARLGVLGDERAGHAGAPPNEGQQPGLDDHGRTRLARGGDGEAAGRVGGDRGRPRPRERRDGDRRRPGGDRGGRCAGGRSRRRSAGLRGDAGAGGVGHGDGGLCHGGRHGHGGRGLYHHQRHAPLRRWRDIEDGVGHRARRRP